MPCLQVQLCLQPRKMMRATGARLFPPVSSQRANVLSLRHEARHLEKVDTREVMASLNFRGPKVLRGQRSHASDASGPGPSRSGTGATGVSGSLGRTSSGRDRPL